MQIAYDSLDRFFYSNFKIENAKNGNYLYAKPNATIGFSNRLDNVKGQITKLWNLIESHSGGGSTQTRR